MFLQGFNVKDQLHRLCLYTDDRHLMELVVSRNSSPRFLCSYVWKSVVLSDWLVVVIVRWKS